MKMEWKDRWVKALRSGLYKQITNQLSDGGTGRCPFGVLFEVYDGRWVQDSEGYYFSKAGPVLYVLSKLRIANYPMVYEKLRRMNDVEGKSFEDIAHWIERKL
jgi:hypothetical protein